MPQTLADWLSYIEQLHPKSIDMGLGRVEQVVSSMSLSPSCAVITVAGTNGKGSTAAMLESMYVAAGYQVACYSSPHFIHYNERLRINQQAVSDSDFCRAFEAVEVARQAQSVDLTYFEFGTLAAFYLFQASALDVAVLEVGLGGRLDAVNVLDADCAIVTNVALDHQEYLGDTREAIAREKSGVYRPNKPAICGDEDPPNSLIEHARTIGADLRCINQDFSLSQTASGLRYSNSADTHTIDLIKLGLSGEFQLQNAACALTAVQALQALLPVRQSAMVAGLADVKLTGRFEIVPATDDMPTLIFDVAHNPHAALGLANQLNATRDTALQTDYTVAVYSMLIDKDWQQVIQALEPYIDDWCIGAIDQPRGTPAEQLSEAVVAIDQEATPVISDSVSGAFEQALKKAQDYICCNKTVKILVFGSFFTVSDVKLFLQQKSSV